MELTKTKEWFEIQDELGVDFDYTKRGVYERERRWETKLIRLSLTGYEKHAVSGVSKHLCSCCKNINPELTKRVVRYVRDNIWGAKRYDHDCDSCEFLGQFGEVDLWFCPGEPTIIIRRSSEVSDYSSGLEFIDTAFLIMNERHPQSKEFRISANCLFRSAAKAECVIRAMQLGILPYNWNVLTLKELKKKVMRMYKR
jgi:hypothetical protein